MLPRDSSESTERLQIQDVQRDNLRFLSSPADSLTLHPFRPFHPPLLLRILTVRNVKKRTIRENKTEQQTASKIWEWSKIKRNGVFHASQQLFHWDKWKRRLLLIAQRPAVDAGRRYGPPFPPFPPSPTSTHLFQIHFHRYSITLNSIDTWIFGWVDQQVAIELVTNDLIVGMQRVNSIEMDESGWSGSIIDHNRRLRSTLKDLNGEKLTTGWTKRWMTRTSSREAMDPSTQTKWLEK